MVCTPFGGDNESSSIRYTFVKQNLFIFARIVEERIYLRPPVLYRHSFDGRLLEIIFGVAGQNLHLSQASDNISLELRSNNFEQN